ncbi:TonB-dependent receptor plug domain-containing protein [Chitinophaga cymbidii]|uniref:TonB-dependent receptor n=1 Tax=Chitinophaga cymbidii TaxID=1096750 RepID=A0A512RRT4_9BACT|nr:TonB-dependent receptor [Chitinophaga cymbidii]GEP98408.1 TonB-dependent receptor [Chitinophaga cymbidii]
MKTIVPLAIIHLILFSFSATAQRDSSGVFHLGEVVIKDIKQDVVNREDIDRHQRLNVATALNLLPGVTLGSVGPRNESVVFIRGFNLRQVPVFVDGVPVYVPYDGYVDLARFTTFGVSRIDVSKGSASVLYGPNTMGGAINLVSVKPVHRLDLEAGAGWLAGGHEGYLNIGGRLKKFYVQAGVSRYKRDHFGLSGNYTPTKTEDGKERENSMHEDVQFNIKIGYTPNSRSEYAIGYIDQQGEKGTPVYAGADSLNSLLKNPRYWKWPYWNKKSLYFISNMQPDSLSEVKLRVYFDQFRNRLDSYDDGSYTAQTRPYAFSSIYDDHSIGASAEYSRNIRTDNRLSAALHAKRDIHKEHNIGEPVRKTADNTYAVSISDEQRFSDNWAAKAGVSWNMRENDGAENYDSQTGAVSQFDAATNTAWNVQASLARYFTPARSVRASFGRMTRLATIKDRYSYRMGTAVPNPALKAEHALHYELSYEDASIRRVRLQAAVFYSSIGNVIQNVNNVQYDTPAGRWLSQMQNKGRAAFYGGEAAVSYNIGMLQTGINYSFIRRKNLDDKNIRFTDVPEHKLSGTATYSIARVALTVDGEYNTYRYSTSYGTKAPGFFLLHGSLAVPVQSWLQVRMGVNNIFDKDYVLVEGFPEQGRNYFIKLNFNYSIL